MDIEYIEVSAAFVALGCYTFLLYRWWYQRLVLFAERYDEVERRRQANRGFPLVMLGLMVPLGAALFGSILHTNVNSVFIVITLLACVVPSQIWWFKKMQSLSDLGYGRKR